MAVEMQTDATTARSAHPRTTPEHRPARQPACCVGLCASASTPPPPLQAASASPSSSVHPLETNAPLSDLFALQSRWQRLCHAQHRSERLAVAHAFAAAHADGELPEADRGWLSKQCSSMASCGHSPRIFATADGRASVRGAACRCRMCPLCAHRRARANADRCLEATRRMDAIRFLTLTLDHRDEPLAASLDRLLAGFKLLRKQQGWKQHVTGAIYGIEAHPSANGVGWHVHLHALIDGVYWAHDEIKAAWASATGSACIVDIRQVNSRAAAAGYVTKYCTKPPAMRRWSPGQIVEFALGLRGRRLLTTCGHLHGRDVDAADKPAEPREPSVSLPATLLRQRLDEHDPQAIAAAVALEHASPWIWRTLTDDGTHPAMRHPPAVLILPQQLPSLLAAFAAAEHHNGHTDQLCFRPLPPPRLRCFELFPLEN